MNVFLFILGILVVFVILNIKEITKTIKKLSFYKKKEVDSSKKEVDSKSSSSSSSSSISFAWVWNLFFLILIFLFCFWFVNLIINQITFRNRETKKDIEQIITPSTVSFTLSESNRTKTVEVPEGYTARVLSEDDKELYLGTDITEDVLVGNGKYVDLSKIEAKQVNLRFYEEEVYIEIKFVKNK